jgi:hypothetical protein
MGNRRPAGGKHRGYPKIIDALDRLVNADRGKVTALLHFP